MLSDWKKKGGEALFVLFTNQENKEKEEKHIYFYQDNSLSYIMTITKRSNL